jgi:hypothetical protein
MAPVVTMKQLLESGVHFGHQILGVLAVELYAGNSDGARSCLAALEISTQRPRNFGLAALPLSHELVSG